MSASGEGTSTLLLPCGVTLTDNFTIHFRKMVNVTSHLPFNLYNRTLAALDPSSSRSASTNRESQSPQTYGPPTRSGPRTASPYSAEQSSSRKVSQLRSSSPRSSRRGRSIHSVDGQTEDGELASPRPILNVRLVRRCGPGTSGRRGRKRLKVGESPHPGDKGKGRDLGSDTQPAATVAQNPPEVLDGLDGQMLSSGGDGTASSATLQGVRSSCSLLIISTQTFAFPGLPQHVSQFLLVSPTVHIPSI